MLRDQPPKPRETEHLTLGVMRFDKAIAVEEGAIASLQRCLLLLVGKVQTSLASLL